MEQQLSNERHCQPQRKHVSSKGFALTPSWWMLSDPRNLSESLDQTEPGKGGALQKKITRINREITAKECTSGNHSQRPCDIFQSIQAALAHLTYQKGKLLQ